MVFSKYSDAIAKYEKTKMLSAGQSESGGNATIVPRSSGAGSSRGAQNNSTNTRREMEEEEDRAPKNGGGGGGDESGGTDRPALDVNKYATKKTIAQGMLDIALLTANASQLKYVLTVGDSHQFYTLLVILISVSIGLQALVALLSLSLNMLRDCRLDDDEYRISSLVINHASLCLVFAITLLNVLMSAIGYVGPPVVAHHHQLQQQLQGAVSFSRAALPGDAVSTPPSPTWFSLGKTSAAAFLGSGNVSSTDSLP